MLSYRKKKGFTVMELVIVIALTVVVLEIVWTMFSVSNKIISDVTIKSDLQREGQAIQEKLSNIGMQATAIESVNKNELKKTQTIQINSYYKSESSPAPFYIRYDYGETNRKLYINDSGDINNKDADYRVLSDNIDSVKINNEDIIDIGEDTLKNINAVDFTITLSKNRNYNNKPITQLITIRTVFRNKETLGN